MKKTLAATALLGTGLFGLAGCVSNDLEPLKPTEIANAGYVRIESHFCTDPRENAKQKVKYLFILDHSASNQPGFSGLTNSLNNNDVAGTDPNGYRRYGLLQYFIQQFVNNPNPNSLAYFALIDFNDFAYQPLAKNTLPPNPPQKGGPAVPLIPFNSDPSDFLTNYLAYDWIGNGGSGAPGQNPPTPYDSGFTNYDAALQVAYQLIQSDAQSEAANPARPIVASSYQIIFVSDGVPLTASGASTVPQGLPPNISVSGVDLTTDINNIVGLRDNVSFGQFISAISLNTVYYTTSATGLTGAQTAQQASAQQLLTQMALLGDGQAQSLGTGQQVNYQVFAPPVRNLKYLLTDAYVENINATWWDNGTLMVDSDGDGIPDAIEKQLGSNPLSADSDGNGVSDLVEYRTKGTPCKDSKCNPAGRDIYGICAGFSPAVAADGSVTFASTGTDGLNDCEKFVLGANRSLFDSNGDFVPDLLALKNLLAVIPGANTTFLNPFGDAWDNYTKLKNGYPIGISQGKVQNFRTRVTTLVHNTSAATSDNECYDFAVDPVVVTGGGNTLKISVVENTALIDDKPILRTAVRTLSGVSSPVVFNPGDFQ